MCGRFAFYSPAEAVAELFEFEPTLEIDESRDGLGRAKQDALGGPRYNIAPTEPIPVVRSARAEGRELVMLRWGLVPYWAKDPSIGNRMINARAETVADKPAYRDAYQRRRCLVLADGFYEWRKGASGKTPWFISLRSGQPFAFAGLWEAWTDRTSGERLETATIITTAANEFLKELHDRMPVVLQPDNAGAWLEGSPGVLEAVTANPPEFQAWPVSRAVNNSRTERAHLIERVANG
jgi:putative SOS response-associated peptidase YedK